MNWFKKDKKIKVSFVKLENSIVLGYEGKSVTIHRDDSRFEKVVACIRENRLSDIPAITDASERYFAERGLSLVDGLVHVDGQPLPSELSDRILDYQANDLPLTSLIAFWNNLKNNTSFNVRKMLYRFLSHNGHPLTDDGCFVAYRGVNSEFKDMHTGKFDNSVGSVCRVDRSEVDDNPTNLCSYGLHVACFNYAQGFGAKLIAVKVDPKDVVCVPEDYNGTKMRVCAFEVLEECHQIIETPVYQEDYAL